jgi:hypothetical protein
MRRSTSMHRFSFEREVLASLELVPLTVRRKLDLACLKLSLEAWQALPLADRRALVDQEVEDEASIRTFEGLVVAAAERAGVTAAKLAAPPQHPWRAPSVPDTVRAKLAQLGATLEDATWAGLDDDARFALVHFAKDARREDRLRAALVELGLVPEKLW